MTQTLRDILRERTREAHERIDTLYGGLSVMKRDDLVRFLTAHYFALAPVEAAIGLRNDRGPVPPALTSLVCRDLDALGVSMPGAPAHPYLDRADPDGLVYVVAGSHLGARVLRRQWAQSSDRIVRGAGRYLSSEAMAAFWPVFLADLNARPVTAATTDRLVAGALSAFAAFERAFALAGEVRSGGTAS